MKKRFTLLLLSIMLAMPFIAYASQPSEAQSRAGGDNNGTFAYVITSPEPGDEKFYNISIQFTNAHTIAFIPSFFDRSNYVEFKRDGEIFTPEYAYPGFDGNTLNLDLGGETGLVNERWEVTLLPGLFNLLDENSTVIAENPRIDIVVTEGTPQSEVDFSFETEPADPNGKLLLTSLSSVSFTFTALTSVSVDADAVVVTAGETTVDKSSYTVVSTGSDNVVTVNFNPAINSDEDITATVTFPEEALTGTQADSSDSNKAPVEASYTIVPPAVYDLDIDFYTPKPDADSNISVGASFGTMILVCDTPDIKAVLDDNNVVTLKEVDGDFESTTSITTLSGMEAGKSTFIASFQTPVYNGKYTITIPKGVIGDTRWRGNHEVGRSNDEVVLTFKISDGQEKTPHIDLSTAYTDPEIITVKGVPSDNNIYWYANIIEASQYPGDDEILEAVINFFKTGAELFNQDWITIYQMTAKKGTVTWGFDDLYPASDYIVYALGLDENGKLYIPVTKIDVRTADPIISDNTFSVELVSVDDGTEPETKKVTVKVKPTNDDAYTAVVVDKYITDRYDLTDPVAEKEYMRNELRQLVEAERIYTGEQTIVFDNIKIDAFMQVAVYGIEGRYETTSPEITDFSTVDENFEAMFIEAYDPTISGVSASVYSFDMARPYIFGVISADRATELGGIEKVHENYNIPSWEAATMGYYDWKVFARRDLNFKPLDGPLSEIAGISSLKWDTEYYLYGYLMDDGGYRTSPVYYTSFTTAPRNTFDLGFELRLDKISSNAPYSSTTYTAEMTIIPTNASENYALYYGETYDFEKYLEEDRLQDWIYDVFMQRRVKKTYSGELNFGYGGVYADKKYILIVTGFDEAPTTEPVWMLFDKDGVIENTSSGVGFTAGSELRVYSAGRAIYIDGDFNEAVAYTADGVASGTFSGNRCNVNNAGCYIVRVCTDSGTVTRKVVVR